MIPNITRTASYLYAEFLYRIEKHRTRENLSYELVLQHINNSIKELYTLLLPYREYAYQKTLIIGDGTNIPYDFYKVIRVMVDGLNVLQQFAGMSEARYVTPYEWYAMTDTTKGHSWNKATVLNPVYTIWNVGITGSNDPNNLIVPDRLRIFLAPNGGGGVAEGLMEYYGLPNDLFSPDDVLEVPALYEEFVLNVAVLRFLMKQNTGNIEMASAYISKIKELKQGITQRLGILDYNVKRELQTFFAPTTPYVPQQPMPGELASKLPQ